MSIYKKIVSVCTAAALAASFISLPVSADNGMTRYEAEAQHTGGWADVEEKSGASGGAIVSNIGGKSTDIGTVVFKVWAPEAGNYNAKIAYLSTNASNFYIRVNWPAWDTGNDTKIDTTASANIQTKDITLSLNKGWNDVKIYSTNGQDAENRIGIDYLDIDADAYVIPNIIENTEANLNGDAATTTTVYKASDGSAITGLGQNGSADFNVTADEAGKYEIAVWYSSADYRALEMYVDDNIADTIYCPITGESDRVDTVTASLNLTEGNHKITFKNQYGQAPDIDKIRFIKAEDTSSADLFSINTEPPFTNGIFSIDYNLETGKADYKYKNDVKVKGFESVVKVNDSYDSGDGNMINSVVKSSDYTNRYVTYDTLNDAFGQGELYTVVNEAGNLPTMYQKFYVYENLPYALVQVELGSDSEISTNFMAPISASGTDVVNIGAKTDARALFVPFQNDDYVAYNPEKLNGAHTSYFVTAIFDNDTRNSVVVGSVDHDTWKTGTSTWAASDNGSINFFGAFAGIWSKKYTFDYQPHGSISGTSVSSPKMFLGYFGDWRDGMDAYGDANKRNNGKLSWDGGSIFGFNSWNAHGSAVTLQNMKDAADEMETLKAGGFCDENEVTWVNIDSYWDMGLEQKDSDENGTNDLDEYVKYCHDKGLKVGLYTTLQVTWDSDLNGWGVRNDTVMDEYGNPVAPAKPDTNSFSLDPTSDAYKNKVKEFMTKYSQAGFDFLKIDFMSFSALEGCFQDKNVTTGMQAYNAMCKEFTKYIDTNKFFISYSIAPLFPSQYAHARRLSCDVATEKYEIFGNTDLLNHAKYMLNAVQYGWWQDGNLYEYTDPDQISFYVPSIGSINTAAARGKYTSGVIAGGVMLLSNKFSDEKARQTAEAVAKNEAVNEVVRIGKAFRPTKASDAWSTPYESDKKDPDNVYYMEDNGYTYVAVFNFDSSAKTKSFNLADVGLDPSKSYSYTELWDNESGTVNAGTSFTSDEIEAYSANLYKIESGADSKEEKTEPYYIEDFEGEDVVSNIENLTNGWTANDNGKRQLLINDWSGDTGRGGKSLRHTAEDWYSSSELYLDLEENAKYKLMQSGISEEEAAAAVNNWLEKENVSISFKANFTSSDMSGDESFIRVRDGEGNTLLRINARHKDGNKLQLMEVPNLDTYKISDASFASGNNKWYEFKIDFNRDDNTFRLSVDGTPVNPGSGEWIPLGRNLGKLKRLDFGLFCYAAWQAEYIDDIMISPLPDTDDTEFAVNADVKTTASDRDEIYPGDMLTSSISASGGEIDNDKTEIDFGYRPAGQTGYQPMTSTVVPEDAERVMMVVSAQSTDGKTARKTVYADVEPYDRSYITESFDDNTVYEDIRNNKNGWRLYGDENLLKNKEGAVQNINGTLRFVALGAWTELWLDKDIAASVKNKYKADGWSESAAAAKADSCLSGALSVSFKAGFQYDGDSDTDNLNRSYIRLRGEDDHTFAEIYDEYGTNNGGKNTLYLTALNADKNENKRYEIATNSNSEMVLYDFKFITNEAGNAYKLYINGEQFTDTDFGEDWIPASSKDDIGAASQKDIGKVAKLTLGEYWTAYYWYQTIWFDNLKVEPIMYDIDTSKFAGGTVTAVRSRKSADTAEEGNRIFVKAVPAEGYKNELVEPLKVNGEEIGENGMFIMPKANAVITGAFKENPKQLAAPAGLTFSNGTASWSAVPNSAGYTVQLYKKSGDEYVPEGNAVTLTSELTYTFTGLPVGDYVVKVKALGDGGDKFSDSDEAQSDVYRQKGKLAAPTGLKLENGKAEWTAVPDADYYTVQLYSKKSSESESIAAGSVIEVKSGTSYDFGELIKDVGLYTFKVRARGNADGFYTDSDISDESNIYTYVKQLETPVGLTFANGTASWSKVDNASSYSVQLYKSGTAVGEAKTATAAAASYTFNFADENADAGDYTFRVTAVGEGFYTNSNTSDESPQYRYSVMLRAPANVQLTKEKASWNAVANAESYIVQLYKKGDISDTLEETFSDVTGTETAIDFTDKEVGDYYVVVNAVGDSVYYYNSGLSAKAEYTHSIQLEAPTILAFENGVAKWSPVEHALSYSVRIYKYNDTTQQYDAIGNFVQDITETEYNCNITSVGKYSVHIRAEGDDKYYKQGSVSYSENDNITYTYTVNLGKPASASISINGIGSWEPVDNASGYSVKIYKKSESGGEGEQVGSEYRLSAETTSLVLPFTEDGTYYITVKAEGNDYYIANDETATSNEYVFVQMPPVDAPSNLSLEAGADKRTLNVSWDSVGDSEGYTVQLYKKAAVEDSEDTMIASRHIESSSETECTFDLTERGTYYVHIIALGNGTTSGNSDFAISDEYEHNPAADKLEAPDDITFENGVAEWSAVEGATGYKVQLYKNGSPEGEPETVDAQTRSYTFDGIEKNVGRYTYGLTVLGDGLYYEDSDEKQSGEYTVSAKLSKPVPVSFANGEALWNTVSNADSYSVQLYKDGAAEGEAVVVTDTEYKFTINKAGTYTFTVTAKSNDSELYTDSDESDASAEYVCRIQLPTPQNLTFNNGTAVWDNVAGADRYIVQLYKSGTKSGEEQIVNTNSCSFAISETGSYTFTVKAVSDNELYLDSAEAESSAYIQKTKLTAPQNVLFKNAVLTWDASENATSYDIRLYKDGTAVGDPISVNSGTTYTFDMSGLKAGAYTCRIMAVSSSIYYDNSEIVTSNEYIYSLSLDMPSTVFFENGIAKWSKVDNAEGYSIQLYKEGAAFGAPVSVGADTVSYDFSAVIEDEGTYTYKIKAVGDGTYYTESAEKESGSYIYDLGGETIKLEAPQNAVLDKGIASWTKSDHTAKYVLILYYNGSPIIRKETTDTTYDFTANTAKDGEYYYTVQAIGNGNRYTDSDTVKSTVYNKTSEEEPEPEWGVKSFNLDKTTGKFDITVTAGKVRYNETNVYAALYKNNALVSVRIFNPEFDSNSEYSAEGTFVLPEDMSDISVKVFIWYDGMRPVIDAVTPSLE